MALLNGFLGSFKGWLIEKLGGDMKSEMQALQSELNLTKVELQSKKDILEECKKNNIKNEANISDLNLLVSKKEQTIVEQNNKILSLQGQETPLETELNSKYPKVNLKYSREETDGEYQIDLRDFITPQDNDIPIVKGANDDEIALNGLRWVIDNISYVSDKAQYGYDEYWAYPYQTLKRRRDDCEGGAILLYNILLRSGIPYYKIRLSAGYVLTGEGHCYVNYFCEDTNQWVVLDWCFYPDRNTPINERADYKDNTNYKGVWFSWNLKYIFAAGVKTSEKKKDKFLKNIIFE